MKVLGILFKIALLAIGGAMLVGGGLAGLCGVIAGSGEIFMAGFVPAMLGLMLFIWVIGSFRKKPVEPEQVLSDTDQDQS